MLERLKKWLSGQSDTKEDPISPALNRTGSHAAPRPRPPQQKAPQHKIPRKHPEFVPPDEGLSGKIESNGPGKNVLIRNKYVREDTGTHETLKILDDSLVDSGEESGIDPYNTGGFDRSKNWDKRFGK
jgi:hypothetical protein